MLGFQLLHQYHRQLFPRFFSYITKHLIYSKEKTKTSLNLFMAKNSTNNTSTIIGTDATTYKSLSNDDTDTKEALGNIDELCSTIGVVYSIIQNQKEIHDYGVLYERILWVMSRLVEIQNCIHSIDPNNQNDIFNTYQKDETKVIKNREKNIFYHVQNQITNDHVNTLEVWINEFTDQMPELTVFILPTGCELSSQLQFCRTVCRRAERNLIPLLKANTLDTNVQKYVNRLSDFLFTASRWVNYCEDQEEIQYRVIENNLTKNPKRKREKYSRKMGKGKE